MIKMPAKHFVAVAAAVFGLSACNDATMGPRPRQMVRTQTVKVVDIAPTLSLTGEIQAQVQADVSFRVAGRVDARYADVGEHVNVGDPLARLDPAEASADLEAAKAGEASAEAVLKQSTTAFERQKTLFDSGYATRTTYDMALQNLRTAQASLDSAKAQVGTATDALSYTNLKADHSGVITARTIEVGQVVQPAQTAFTIALDGPRDAVFNVYESVVLDPPTSDKTEISLISDPSITAVGHVREISPTVDSKTGTVLVKIGLDDANAMMPLGAAVLGSARLRPHKIVKLPWSAASTKDGKLAVWVVNSKDDVANLRTAIAEDYENTDLMISNGLSDGDQVVTEGSKFLYPGIAVLPLEEVK